MALLKLKVKFNTASVEELEHFESMNIPVPEDYLEDGYLYVNSDQIVSFNEDSSGNVSLNLSNGGSTMIYMPFDEFFKKVRDLF